LRVQAAQESFMQRLARERRGRGGEKTGGAHKIQRHVEGGGEKEAAVKGL